ncbi:MAG TPA: PLP-dependent lyase/thiolase [Acidimicrobiales bacterium]|nr:PLP-dependent lyase/thiolase [Acidimicrobiales bacterium]
MNEPASRLACSGCGAAPGTEDPYPFRCPRAGNGDVDHVLTKILDTGRVSFPGGGAAWGEPFARYRGLLHSYHRAVSGGMTDAEFVALVERLDEAVARLDGHGFTATPFVRSQYLSHALGFEDSGGVWVKDETHNVSGSHKGRHLMGVLLHLEVAERLGLADAAHRPDLAIASCGNAALAAAIVAAAGGRRLRVFVPVEANAGVVRRLTDLGADVVTCPRPPRLAGDPTYARLREEIAAGALPFTCQGNENGLAIEGGETLVYEMVSDLLASGTTIDHLVVQVGGGALASSCVQAYAAAVGLGVLAKSPRAHTVQTQGGHPLERAHGRVARTLPSDASREDLDRALQEAATHKSAYMWPWEKEPRSIAGGILDDETYDWLAVVGGMLRTGGSAIVVSEERLVEARKLGQDAGFAVDATGSSGLAGLVDLRSKGVVGPGERVAVLFTGIERE